MNKHTKNAVAIALMLVMSLSVASQALAVTGVPDVNLNQPTQPNSPFGAFKLLQCDGPEELGRINPTTGKMDLSKDQNNKFIFPVKDGYVACNFQGLMVQVQFLINAMLVIGVLGAIVGFGYAGFLYITGTQENLKKAHSIFPKVFWGFILMLTAWFIVYQIVQWLTGSSGYKILQ